MIQVQHAASEKGGAFFYEKDGKRLAEMEYVMAGTNKLIIDHTDVDESLKGQGIGKSLLSSLVAFARDNKLKVMPLCPFAKATFDKTPDWQDVLF